MRLPRVLLMHKLMGVMVGTIVVLVGAVATYFSVQRMQAMEQHLLFKGATYAELASHTLTSAIAFDDIETARETFSALKEDEDVRGLAVFRSDGDELYKAGDLREEALSARNGVSQPVEFLLPGALLVIRPVSSREGPSGTLVVQLSTASLHQSQADVIRSGLIAGAVALLLGVWLSWLAARSLSKRLSAIAEVAAGVARGDLEQPEIQDETGDEVGALARAINWMVHRLRDLIQQMNEVAKSEQERLARLVSERTHQLQLSEQKAQQANRAKSAFLAKMSHEIRTPLNGVIGVTNLVLEGELPQEQRAHVEIVSKSADTLLALVNDVLDYSKIEAGELVLDPVDFRLHDLIETVAAPLRSLLGDKPVKLGVHCDEAVPDALFADRLRLGQILRNLIHNAIKFTDTGSVDVHVEHQRDGEDVVLQFMVSDTGIGIPKDAQAEIFASFRQVNDVVNRRYGGTGLGLAICHQLVELMGGTISIESDTGKGSRFRFSVRCREARTTRAGQDQSVAQPQGDQAVVVPLRVLLVEDNGINRLVSQRMLESQGHTVVVAEDGQKAVRLTEQDDFDVVLMDVQMPIMDGYSATRAIRQRERHDGRRAPIIALTAHAFRGDLERCREAGMDEYLSKPVRPGKLFEAIQRVVANG